METVTIVGAGIGGLTTALTLKQKGLNVKIFEGSVALKPVGAGIILASNAMQVFKKLGIHQQIENAGNRISYMKITDARLRPISVADLQVYEEKYGVHNVAIHRGVLQKILADELGHDSISLSKRLIKIEKAGCFKLTFEDHTTAESNWLIGADGIRSVVRNQLFSPAPLRNARQICWRGICHLQLPAPYHHELNEAWGKGKRLGFVQVAPGKVYWYALANWQKRMDSHTNLSELFSGFHSDVQAIIAATDKQQIIVSDIIDLRPINKWQDENVCLIGDAAHATTPNLGQGACQAVEDAYVLGKLLDEGLPMDQTFKAYEKLRRAKAHTIVNTSWAIGKLAHIRYGTSLRNFLMKSMGTAANKKQLDRIFKLN